MNKIIDKPYFFFWIFIPLILIIRVFEVDETIDVNIHDVYFVSTKFQLLIFFSSLFLILGFGYFVVLKLDRRLLKLLSFLHILFTFLGCIIILMTFFISDSEIRNTTHLLNSLSSTSVCQTIAVLLIIFGQLFYPFNILFSLFRRKL